jgi:hypothetical protein
LKCRCISISFTSILIIKSSPWLVENGFDGFRFLGNYILSYPSLFIIFAILRKVFIMPVAVPIAEHVV